MIVNKMIAPVVIEQHSDGSVWANYELRPAALLAQATAVGVVGAQELSRGLLSIRARR